MDDVDKDEPIGTKLKNLRKDAGYSQNDIAEIMDRSRENVSAIENNYPGTINVLPQKFIAKWTKQCRVKIKENKGDKAAEAHVKGIVEHFISSILK